MKSSFIPQVRVEPEVRAELESVLRDGETLSSFVETSMRSAVAFRKTQSEFHARGQAAWEDHLSTGRSTPAGEVFDRLQAKVDARRRAVKR